MEWLEEIHKHHNTWIAIAKNFGMEHPEDVVQDFYIELIATSKRKYKENDKRFNPKYANLPFKDKVMTDGKLNKGFIFLIFRRVIGTAHNERKIDYLPITKDPKEETEEKEIKEEKENFFEKVEFALNDCYWYDKIMMETYIKTGFSMRKLSQETGIPYRSVNHAITKVKKALKEELKEDYIKYKNYG